MANKRISNGHWDMNIFENTKKLHTYSYAKAGDIIYMNNNDDYQIIDYKSWDNTLGTPCGVLVIPELISRSVYNDDRFIVLTPDYIANPNDYWGYGPSPTLVNLTRSTDEITDFKSMFDNMYEYTLSNIDTEINVPFEQTGESNSNIIPIGDTTQTGLVYHKTASGALHGVYNPDWTFNTVWGPTQYEAGVQIHSLSRCVDGYDTSRNWMSSELDHHDPIYDILDQDNSLFIPSIRGVLYLVSHLSTIAKACCALGWEIGRLLENCNHILSITNSNQQCIIYTNGSICTMSPEDIASVSTLSILPFFQRVSI